MTKEEMLEAKMKEYRLLKKRALAAEDYFLAEYYDTLINDIQKEIGVSPFI